MTHDKRHGGPYDRGSADKYYGRPFMPHYFEMDTYFSPVVKQAHMTPDEIAAYKAGYDSHSNEKDWGDNARAGF